MQFPIQIDAAGGEYMEDVVILEWGAALGDPVKAGDVIVTVETAKAATEVEAPSDGYLVEMRFAVGDEAPVGQRLGTIAESLDEMPADAPAPEEPAAVVPSEAASSQAAPAAAPSNRAAQLAVLQAGRQRVSPLARRVAGKFGVDLAAVEGSGPRGRIRRADVEAHASRAAEPAPAAPARAPSASVAGSAPAAPKGSTASAAPIVLIHGFADDKSGWRALKPLLDRGHAVLTPELPGHGSAPQAGATRLKDLAFGIADQLRAAGVEAAHVVGHSLGGAVAVLLADLGLVEVRSLGLIAPGGMGPQANTAFINGLAEAETPEALQPWLDTMVAQPATLPDGFARAVLRQRDAMGNGPALRSLAARLFGTGTQVQQVRHRLEYLEMPVRVIWGQADAVLPASQAEGLPAHVGLHRLPGIGHVPQLEAPQMTARLINELLRSAE